MIDERVIMLVIGGRHKGAEMTIGSEGPDWISAYRAGDKDVPTAAAILHPREVEISGEELTALSGVPVSQLWEDFEAYEHSQGKFRLRPRTRVHRIADA